MVLKKNVQPTKDVVAGLGEIGGPLLKLIYNVTNALGYDINPKLTDPRKQKKFEKLKTRFLHICIPFNNNFEKNVLQLTQRFSPNALIIHSTISPGTTKRLQEKLSIPVIYSATRGVHKRMINDLKRYTKFFAIESNAPNEKWASSEFVKLMRKCKVKSKKMTNPISLELAKIVVDTSYYGWLINYAQITNLIATKYGVNYDEMWSFSDEIHKFLGNRPKMYPGFIGGHCVIPNLSLINDESLWQIDRINNYYSKKIPNAKSINKRYEKSKKTSYTL